MPRARQTITHLPIEQLTANPANVREDLGDITDLARSINEQGLLEPLIVTEHPKYGYLLLDGHRRLQAGLKVGLAAFPVIIRHDVHDTAEQTITMLATDVHKKAFTPIERAQAYQSLKNRGLTGSEIARRVGVHPSTITYYLNLLRLDQETMQAVDAGDLPVVEAVAIVVEQRQAERVAEGRPERGRRQGVYFSASHPLASKVRRTCTHHGQQPILGKIGCGPCWEHTIAEDAIARRDGAA